MGAMEHRYGTRLVLDTRVRLIHGAPVPSECVARLLSLSLSGALIQTDLNLQRLARVDVELGTTPIPAFVTRVLAGKLAIEWCERAPVAVRELLRGKGHSADLSAPRNEAAGALPLVAAR